MTKNDPRYEEVQPNGEELVWLSRKPSVKKAQAAVLTDAIASNPLSRAILDSPGARTVAATAGIGAGAKILRSVPKLLKAAAATVATTGSLEGALGTGAVTLGASGLATLAAAGLASYFGTTWLINNFPTKQRRLNAASDAYRKSRADLANHLGRPLTSEELGILSKHYKEVTAAINKYPF